MRVAFVFSFKRNDSFLARFSGLCFTFVSSDCFKGSEAEYRALKCGIGLIGKVKRVVVVNMNLVVLMHKFNQCYC